MTYQFGKRSLRELETCRPELQSIMKTVLAFGLMDFSVIEGHRSDEKQHEYFVTGKSRLDAGNPRAMHCGAPSEAVDIVPFINGKISWNKVHCCVLAGIVLAVSRQYGFSLRWGGNWDMDGEPITDQDFQDLVHFELCG